MSDNERKSRKKLQKEMEWVDDMIRAKLFKSQNIQWEWVTAAEQLEDFISSNLISNVIEIEVVKQLQYMKVERSYTEITEILLIYREGNE